MGAKRFPVLGQAAEPHNAPPVVLEDGAMICPPCSNPVELIGGAQPKTKSFLGMLERTVKMPFFGGKWKDD